MEYIVRLPSDLKQILLQSGAVRWDQLALLRIFFDQNRARSFESGKSLSKSHGNSLRANRGWFITQCFKRLAICPGFCPRCPCCHAGPATPNRPPGAAWGPPPPPGDPAGPDLA